MTDKLKIGIIEDDLLIAESIRVTLEEIGYEPLQPVQNYDDGIQLIEEETPDLLILDITIQGEKDGVDIAKKINEDFQLPFIFLSAYSDKKTLDRTKAVNPFAYLVKPFNKEDLFSAIETAINNFHNQIKSIDRSNKQIVSQDFILIKNAHIYHKVKYNDIIYVKSENVYLSVFTEEKEYLIRQKLNDFVYNHPNFNLAKVHRSYAINLNHLEMINDVHALVKGIEIPLQKNYRKSLLESVESFR